MAINVICPGCMTRFQVDDRFAGKKGPCPKCGHIIEIPKENIVVHAPEDVTSGGKTVKGVAVRPILQMRFIFTKAQLCLALLGIVAVLGVAWLLAGMETSLVKTAIGVVGTWLVGIPLLSYGYMMIRDEEDLEILLGHELYKRAGTTAAIFAVSWFALEWLVVYLEPGVFVVAYLIPIAVLGAFGAVVVFDVDFGNAALLYSLFLISVIVLRGLMYAPDGWIWQNAPVRVRPAAAEKTPETAPSAPAAAPNDKASPADKSEKEATKPAAKPAAQPVRKPLDRNPPDPRKKLNR